LGLAARDGVFEQDDQDAVHPLIQRAALHRAATLARRLVRDHAELWHVLLDPLPTPAAWATAYGRFALAPL